MRYKNPQKEKEAQAQRRRVRARAKIFGTAAVPRLVASRSLKHMRAQLVDDAAGKTVAAAMDTELTAKSLAETKERKGKTAQAYAVGQLLAGNRRAIKRARILYEQRGWSPWGCA